MPKNSNMKRTNTREFIQKVDSYLAQCITDENGDEFAKADDAFTYAYSRFVVEYNYADNRKRFPNHQARVAEWLAGLAIGIEYTYADIIARSEQWHECTLSESERETVIVHWFSFLAMALLRVWNRMGLGVA